MVHEKQALERSFSMTLVSRSIKVKTRWSEFIKVYFRLSKAEFRLWCECVTWLLLIKIEIWPSWPLSGNFLPWMTLNDLHTNVLVKLTLRASFWYIIWVLLLVVFQMWLHFWGFFSKLRRRKIFWNFFWGAFQGLLIRTRRLSDCLSNSLVWELWKENSPHNKNSS